ncbi:MAG: hypothetical protein HOQ29_05130 [Acidobacteria bacterium]|nr:hypothetical protein [Acidobacteriota bacterium]
MAEVLVEFSDSVQSPDGKRYKARACGGEMPDGMWQGWIEFLPRDGGEPLRSARETTQPNRTDTIYWATGLTPIYLEGSLHRTLNPLVRPLAREIAPPVFDGPAANVTHVDPAADSILNPFSVYRKGERLLRRQLGALSRWHLVNIIRSHRLTDADDAALNAATPAALIDLIVDAVKAVEAGASRSL